MSTEKGQAQEPIVFVKPTLFFSDLGAGGYGNGYVALPQWHVCYGLPYTEIEARHTIDVNGGLTYSEPFNPEFHPPGCSGMWIVGFDTLHAWDTIERWPDEAAVMAEANRLRDQLMTIHKTETAPVRPLGFYWVRYGTEWQVARYHYAGWFLTGVSTPLPDGSIDEIGEPVCSNGTIARARRYRRYSATLLGLGIVFFLYSLAVFIYNLLKN